MSNDYLRFSQKERRGISVLIFLTVVAAAAARYGKAPAVAVPVPAPAWSAQPAYAQLSPRDKEMEPPAALPEHTPKNGKEEYSGSSSKAARTRGSPGGVRERASRSTYSRKMPSVLDINMADTAAFIALPGIGPVLAARIVLFREKLGGFHSVSQVREVYGLPDSVFRDLRHWLRCESPAVRKLPLNTASKETLAAHPYIRWAEAKAIVQYRQQHGPFGSLAGLDRILSLDTAVLRKIRPYLSLE